MARGRIAGAVVVTTAAILVIGASPACSSFGTSDPAVAPSEASVDGQPQADGPVDAAVDALPVADAASCDPPVLLDFESGSPFPPQDFAESSSATGSAVTHSAKGGVGGSGALEVDLNVTKSDVDGPYAQLYRHFTVTAAALQLELSFDFIAPAAADLYAAAGCALTLRPSTATTPRTDISTATFNGSGPHLQVSSTPAIGNKLDGPDGTAAAGAFHHIDMKVVVADGGASAVVYSTLDGAATTMTVPLSGPPADVTLSCGFYADGALGTFTAYVDNVRFAICRAR
jgi:hypothetical protein